MRKPKIVGDRVLVRVKREAASSKYIKKDGVYYETTDSGLIKRVLSNDEVAREERASEEAYVIQVGVDAFVGLGSGEPRAKAGDLVSIVRYSGEFLPDIGDNELYRVISDSDILVVWEGEELND